MTSKELKRWLRDNSSGVYRPARDAADLIDQLERELNEAYALLSKCVNDSLSTKDMQRMERIVAAMPNVES
jgi:hypothetical protein